MRVLVACEFSGIVRDAFIAAGHDAMSCDLLPTESPGPHYIGDVRDVLDMGWDMVGRRQDQVVQPWMFGEPVQKAVGLWLVGLPLLLATGPIETERHQLVHKMPPSPDRAKKRSVFFPGIARAMAEQWAA